MGFQTGLSGLNTASKNLDVIGNNVANASVAGFKGSRALFADVFANSLSGAGTNQVGIGSKVGAVAQEFSQGNITTSNNPLDVAINGKGFFRMSNNGTITFSRSGQFHFDNGGYIVNSDGLRLTGYSVDASGNVVATSPVELQISSADIAPKVSTSFKVGLNLDARETPPVVAFSAADPTSYNSSTAGTVYDSLGKAHVLTFFFVKTAVAGQWSLYANVDGGAAATLSSATLQFNNAGALTTAMPLTASLPVTGGAATPLVLSALDFTGTTQYGSNFGVNTLTQDGFTSGRLSGFSIGGDGMIQGRYSNGQSKTLGQIVLSNFISAEGLKPLGNNQWEQTSASGLAIIGTAGSGSLGMLQASAVEDANVDLTAELVNMITAQRVYQANAQSIKTQDAVLQTLVSLR